MCAWMSTAQPQRASVGRMASARHQAGGFDAGDAQGFILVAGLLLIGWLMLEASGGPVAAWQAIPPEAFRLTRPGEHWSARAELWLIPVIGTLVSQEALARTARDTDALLDRWLNGRTSG